MLIHLTLLSSDLGHSPTYKVTKKISKFYLLATTMLSARIKLGARHLIGRRSLASSLSVFEKPQLELTTLKNGLRIITDSTPGHFSALGAYVDAGSRFEDPKNSGLSHIIDRLAWKSTEKYTGVETIENLTKLGGNFMCSAQRESIIYQASVFNPDVEKMFDLIAQTVRYPKLTSDELAETLETAKYEIGELAHKHESLLPEVLHQAAYHKNTLGLPLFCPEDRLNKIGLNDIKDYHNKFYQPGGVVIAMVGVPHELAVKLAEKHLGDWKTTGMKPALEVANYTGGIITLPFQQPLYSNLPELYHMQIGFETNGLLNDDLYALATLQKLLGGGSSFSAGGPGKGMFSRLYTQVLNQYGFVENCSSFNHSYVDSGLFGVTISCSPNAAHVMSQIICLELSKLTETNTAKGGLTEKEVKRAKNQLISALLMNVESKLAKLEDLGRQIQCHGKVTSIDEMIAKIEALSISDLRNVAEKILTGNVVTKGISSGRPSIVMQGDRAAFGDVEFICQHFGLGKFDGERLTEPRELSEYTEQKSGLGRWF